MLLPVLRSIGRRSTVGSPSLLTNVQHKCPLLGLRQTSPTLHRAVGIRTGDDFRQYNHIGHWSIERVASVAMVGAIPLAFVWQHPVVDYTLAALLGAHVHWGLDGVVLDYFRARVVGRFVAFTVLWAERALTTLAFAALIYFCYNDVGICQAAKLIWSI